MYTWSRHQLLDLQAAAQREALLQPNPNIIESLSRTPEVSTNLLNRGFSLPTSLDIPTTSTSNSMVTLHLQEKLEALKRQNQDAISMILARRQLVVDTGIVASRTTGQP